MSISNKVNASKKATTLNPNAAEFVPSTIRSAFGNTKGTDSSKVDSTATLGKSIIDRSESSISTNSDDEAHQYWRHQLPDDITPDFKSIGEDEVQSPVQLSLAGLSIRDGIESSRFSPTVSSETFGTRQVRSPFGTNNLNLSGTMAYIGSAYSKDQSSVARNVSSTNSWDKQFNNRAQRLTRRFEGQNHNGDSSFVNNMLGDQAVIEDGTIGPLEFLASRFPGLSAESLADMYYANGCDLNFTIEMLGQLELQGDGGFTQNLNSKSMSVPSLSRLELQSLHMAEPRNWLSKYTRDLHQLPDAYRSSYNVFRGATDFTTATRKFSPLDGAHWKHERNGSADGSIGSSRSSQLLSNSYNGHGKLLYGDKGPIVGASTASPVWHETGEAMANMVSEPREEVRELARLRDAYLEQASQAYMIGNKSLAMELSEKGHLYNMQLKAAQLKAGDTIYRKRDPIPYELQGYNRGGRDGVIDLQGLHVSDTLQVLKHELNILRSAVGRTGQQVQATVLLGPTGPHSKGTRLSPRLPMAVEQFLLDEGLPYTQPQPGLLHVVIY